jgi:hypothetical protein
MVFTLSFTGLFHFSKSRSVRKLSIHGLPHLQFFL